MTEAVKTIREEKRAKGKDWLLIIGLLLAGLVVAGLYGLKYRQGGDLLQVSVAGEVVQTYLLEQDTDVVIRGVNGGTNHLRIEGGQAWLTEASCPDKLCVHMGRISGEGQTIVCLPNQVVLEVLDAQSETKSGMK